MREAEVLEYYQSLGMPVPTAESEPLRDLEPSAAEDEILFGIMDRHLTLTPVANGCEYVIRYGNK